MTIRWHGRLAAATLVLAAASPPLAAQRTAPPRAADIAVATGQGWYGFAYTTEPVRGAGSPLRLVVREVVAGSPAERSGLRSGDRIVAFDGRPITRERLERLQESVRPGETVRLRLQRGGETRDVRMVAEAPRAGVVILGNGQAVAIRPDTVFRMMEIFLDSVGTAVGRMQIRVDSMRGIQLRGGPTAEGTRFYTLDENGRARLHEEFARAAEQQARTLRELDQIQALRQAQVQQLQRGLRPESVDSSFWRLVTPEGQARYRARVATGGPPPGSWAVYGANSVAGALFKELGPQWRGPLGVERGLLVLEVAPGLQADRGGLREGDVIIAAGGSSVSTMAELRERIRESGRDGLAVEVVRERKRHALRLPMR